MQMDSAKRREILTKIFRDSRNLFIINIFQFFCMSRNLFIILFLLLFPLGLFAQNSPWYQTAFKSEEGKEILIMDSTVFVIDSNMDPECLILGYSKDGVTANEIILYNLEDGFDAGSIILNLNETIEYDGVAFRKSPNRLQVLKSKFQKFHEEARKKREKELASTAKEYSAFIESNKWLVGLWRYPNSPSAFIITHQDIIEYEAYDGETRLDDHWIPSVAKDNDRYILYMFYLELDSGFGNESEISLYVNPRTQTVTTNEDVTLKKVFP